jgi:twitching motility two-component system response regulator PilH
MVKVMVVDDSFSELKVIESMLRHAGFEVLTYTDGEGLEDKVASEKPDVLLLDIVMPKRNGYEILRGVKRDERTRHTPVVLVSQKNQPSDERWGRRQGADDYVTKPFAESDLTDTVRRLVR